MIHDDAALKAAIRDVPDFPKKGVVFKDITTLLKEPRSFRLAVDRFVEMVSGHTVDKVIAIESRGFILGGVVADRLGAGFVPVRKVGKLPWRTRKASYELEYGTEFGASSRGCLDAGDRVWSCDLIRHGVRAQPSVSSPVLEPR